MKPIVHSRIHAKKYGGIPEDYLPIDDFMDSSKMCLPDVRHRMLLHNSFGVFIAERVFGHVIVNSDGKAVSVRDIAEDHVIQDLGKIPTVEQCFASMSLEPWMGGKVSKYAAESKPQPVEVPKDNIFTVPLPNPIITETPIFTNPRGSSILTDTSIIIRNDDTTLSNELEDTTMFFDGQGARISQENLAKLTEQLKKD